MIGNQKILDRVEELGGGYVWDAEVFAIILLDCELDDKDASVLLGLQGIQQIAINAGRLSAETIRKLAGISGIESLVLGNYVLSGSFIEEIRVEKGIELIVLEE